MDVRPLRGATGIIFFHDTETLEARTKRGSRY